MDTRTTTGPRTNSTGIDHHLDDTVWTAFRVAGRGRRVRAVTVVLPERPSYGELLRYRHFAQANDLTLSVDASGLTVRPLPKRVWSVWLRMLHGTWLDDIATTEGNR